jgi:hypothetical protein
VLPLVDLGRRLDGGAAAADGAVGAIGAIEATSPALCIITRSRQAIAFPVEAVLGLQALPALPPNGGAAASPWEILDPLIVDLARDQDPAH